MNSKFFEQPLKYAISIYSFYECFKCKSPYCGGMKNCEQDMEI